MNFSELNLHPTVAGALAKRGYDTATPVQAAVLHADAAGRDLLVSSQTGSGKTIAFGAALAESLLAPDAVRTGQRTNPLALVIVPTRELAVQVREELGWLLRDTKLRLASFTGGTPVSGDLRTLQKGLDIAIGTPGRLVDLLKRQRLELTDIRVVVLDEADEMLDLGFREDLQTLLQAAPEKRRTLLLSATLPSEIQALARRFQRDALRIDPRKDGDQAARGGHGDITYVAHLIAGADRLAVVVNILRAAGDGRAIVFCTTREGVSRLHAALLQRGFSATAISGDRAQAERDRALEQVRKGDARILVATNVAARGLHLPDVDLIIHADLPLNAESLTHRSGRTGRAGRKGTAVVIASMTERRKAERLMMSANVPIVWTAPPSAESITAAARERLAEDLLQEATAETSRVEDPAADEMITRLEQTLPARELARRLLLRELVHLPVGERVHHVAVPGPERRDRFAPARPSDDRGGDDRRPGRGDFAREGVMFRVNLGARDNADPRWLLPLICRRGGVESRNVGAIRVGPDETLFEISGDAAADFALSAAERDPRAPHVTFEPARAGDNRGRDSRGPGPGRPPAYKRPIAARNAEPPPQPAAPRKAPAPAPEARALDADRSPPAPEQRPTGATKMPAIAAAKAATAAVKERPAAASTNGPTHPATDRPEPIAPAAIRQPHTRPVPNEEATLKPPAGKLGKIGKIDKVDKVDKIGGHAPHPDKARPAARPAPRAHTLPVPPQSPQPASIFQTRVPEPPPATYSSSPRAEHAGRSARPTAGGPLIELKRAPHVGPSGPRPPSAARADAGPPRRPEQTERPRTDGTNPVRRSFAPRPAPAAGQSYRPPHGARPPGRAAPAANAAAGPSRPPFWKDGARKRPAGPSFHAGGGGPKGKAPRT